MSMSDYSVMRKLWFFVALSIATHLWLMYGVPLEMPRFDAAPRVLEARLHPAPPLPPVLPRVEPPPLPKPHVRPRAPAEPVLAVPSSAAPPVYVPPPQPPAVVADAAPVEAAPPPPPPAIVASKPIAEPPPVKPLARRLPPKGEITYALYLGNDRFNVGRTLQSWEINGDRYRLASVSETTGLASVFTRQRMAYESQGKLTP